MPSIPARDSSTSVDLTMASILPRFFSRMTRWVLVVTKASRMSWAETEDCSLRKGTSGLQPFSRTNLTKSMAGAWRMSFWGNWAAARNRYLMSLAVMTSFNLVGSISDTIGTAARLLPSITAMALRRLPDSSMVMMGSSSALPNDKSRPISLTTLNFCTSVRMSEGLITRTRRSPSKIGTRVQGLKAAMICPTVSVIWWRMKGLCFDMFATASILVLPAMVRTSLKFLFFQSLFIRISR
mmetsp:Transcript_39440/g.98725  ORF Transcript_39440/g.98725 Transcript_39440/m.98725 type:complete len:239 (-) Transcript_39440:252-968(-)